MIVDPFDVQPVLSLHSGDSRDGAETFERSVETDRWRSVPAIETAPEFHQFTTIESICVSTLPDHRVERRHDDAEAEISVEGISGISRFVVLAKTGPWNRSV